MDWESQMKELAERKGIEYKGPMRPPPKDVNGKGYRRRKFRFDQSERTRELLQLESPDQVFVQISFGTEVDFQIKNIVPESEIQDEHELDDQNKSEENTPDSDGDIENPNENITSGFDDQSSERQSEGQSKNNDSQSSTPTKSTSELTRLRKEAEQAAVETVPDSVKTQQTTQQYTRSSEVREYVMARANGQCEGCNEPAPFTSKSGEPYLHAHHINELSKGGSDTPSTVIALCPNCHYRVHHGENGEEYNQELAERLEDRE